jgi:DNA-binding HxlR family transcriptional regulator
MIGSSPRQAYRDSTVNRGWQSSKQVDQDKTTSASSRRESKKRVASLSRIAEECSAQFAINLIHGKWKTRILSRLQHGPTRLSELRRMFPEASKKMLAQHLRELEKDGLVIRTDLSGRVRHVEYSLSHSLGFAALHLIGTLAEWGREYLPYMVSESE